MTEKNEDELTKIVGDKVIPELVKVALTPSAEELGKGLVTIARTINLALEPLAGVIWGYEKIKAHVIEGLVKRFADKPESIIKPRLNVVGPLIESMKFTAQEETLREMYINLLASSMDAENVNGVHPSYVEVIRQLTADEAKIISFLPTIHLYPIVSTSMSFGEMQYDEVARDFRNICKGAGVEYLDQSPQYLDNLRRLLLLEFR